jgi:uncharacterized membrane protein (UPF0127 family)
MKRSSILITIIIIILILFIGWFAFSRYLVSRLNGDFPGNRKNADAQGQSVHNANDLQQGTSSGSALSQSSKNMNDTLGASTPTISIGSATLQLELADTAAERTQGLSGRASLPQNTGLLFIFENSAMWGFWMKDMHFSIDMIWLDRDFNVVGLKENATPESYPQSFTPDKPALYVLETNTGFIKQHQIKLGTQLMYNKNN